MDDIKKPEEQVSAAPAELTQEELDKVAGGSSEVEVTFTEPGTKRIEVK